VFALGLVLLAMRQIGQPQGQQNLQRWLHLETPLPGDLATTPLDTQQTGARAEAAGTASAPAEKVSQAGALSSVHQTPKHPLGPLAPTAGDFHRDLQNSTLQLDLLLQAVQDNTSFRPQEQAAWFALLALLEQSTPSSLQQKSVGNLSYAQLLGQPAEYRGKVVTLHGTVLREEPLRAPTNSRGILDYHRLILQPSGGGEWPFVVYALKLPANFPRGTSIRARIEVRGYFFKNWSYSWGDGLGLAPVVLAKNVRWLQEAAHGNALPPAGERPWTDWKLLLLATLAAALFAGLVLKVAWRSTGRYSPTTAGTATCQTEQQIHDTLRQLSERESREK